VNGDRAVTVLLTRWETDHDAEQFDHALLNKGKYFFRYGVNVLVIAGDVGDKAEAAAVAALQGAKFGPTQ
jgi:coproporphyrinogen III oxidase